MSNNSIQDICVNCNYTQPLNHNAIYCSRCGLMYTFNCGYRKYMEWLLFGPFGFGFIMVLSLVCWYYQYFWIFELFYVCCIQLLQLSLQIYNEFSGYNKTYRDHMDVQIHKLCEKQYEEEKLKPKTNPFIPSYEFTHDFMD